MEFVLIEITSCNFKLFKSIYKNKECIVWIGVNGWMEISDVVMCI